MIIATGGVDLAFRMLSEVARSPTLLLFNVVAGAVVAVAGFFISKFARRQGWLIWALGAGSVVAAAWFAYFPPYPAAYFYKEAEIPAGQFTHMVLLIMFPIVPLLLVLSYIVGGVRNPAAGKSDPGGQK